MIATDVYKQQQALADQCCAPCPPQVHTEAVDAAQYELCIQSATAWMPSEVVHALRRTVAQLIQPAPNAASMTRAQDESAIQSRLSSVRVRPRSLSLCVVSR